MAQILVRDLDDVAVERLKARARQEGRSLQAEAKLILEQASLLDMQTMRKRLDAFRRRFGGRRFSDSADLIREDRDR
ncbi:MAG: hypothetical protein FJ291_01700 [Planctomycetes bacterium]|nr:hypothetical protein [Planctomycetota bacterium]